LILLISAGIGLTLRRREDACEEWMVSAGRKLGLFRFTPSDHAAKLAAL
jgi:hypothetical protein